MSAGGAPRTADVLVVGAGLSGLGVARGLVQRGARVTLLEAETEDGAGSVSFALEGLAAVDTPEPHARMAAAIGVQRTAALLDLARRNAVLLSDLSSAHPEVGAAAGGACVTTDATELAEIAAGATACGWEMLPDPETVTARTGATGFIGGALRAGDIVIDPRATMRLLEHQARDGAAQLHRGARVEQIDVDGSGVAARGRGLDYRAELLVMCAGAGVTTLHPGLAACVVPVPGQGLTMHGPAAGPQIPLALSANFGHVRLAWRAASGAGPRALHLLRAWLIPWSLKRPEQMEQPAEVDLVLLKKLEDYARAHLPAAALMQVTQRRAARMAYTQDNLPLVGPLPGQPRVACCTGFSGHDWSLALAAADALAAALSGSPRDPVLELLSPRRLMVS